MKQERVLAYQYQGTRYDCGSKLGYMRANVDYALRHPEISQDFSDWLGKKEI
jgi:UTP--glucose-1-phosphate uridylyltransferase